MAIELLFLKVYIFFSNLKLILGNSEKKTKNKFLRGDQKHFGDKSWTR